MWAGGDQQTFVVEAVAAFQENLKYTFSNFFDLFVRLKRSSHCALGTVTENNKFI